MKEKIQVLIKEGRSVFHTDDLALLWNVHNRNTLYTTIKRYVKLGLLIRIYKGLYSSRLLEDIDGMELAMGYTDSFGYLTTETILARSGVINQQSDLWTLAGEKSRSFEIGGKRFLVRKLSPGYLYNESGLIRKGDFWEATVERAVADMLYFSPKYYFDNLQLVDREKVKKIRMEVYGKI